MGRMRVVTRYTAWDLSRRSCCSLTYSIKETEVASSGSREEDEEFYVVYMNLKYL